MIGWTNYFLQQLFTHLYLKWVDDSKPRCPNLTAFDEYLIQEYQLEKFDYIPRKNGEWKGIQQRTLPYIVKNEIDHLEVLENDINVWSEENLRTSI